MFEVLVLFSFIVCLGFTLHRIWGHTFKSSAFSNIPGPTPTSWLTGNLTQLFSPNSWHFHEYMTDTYGKVAKFSGLLSIKQLYLYDPLGIHQILVKDHYLYEEPEYFYQMNRLIFGPSIFATIGETHRKQRKVLSQIFSINNLRSILPVFYDISFKVQNSVESQIRAGETEIDILFWVSRGAFEIIGECGFGHTFDDLLPDADPHPFATAMKRLAPLVSSMMLARRILPFVMNLGTPRLRRLFVDWCPWKDLHDLRDMADIMHQTSVEVYQSRTSDMESGKATTHLTQGKDVLTLLLKSNTSGSGEDQLSEPEVLSQMSSLIFGAMDTTTSSVTRILQCLAEHPVAQQRLREELSEARKSAEGELDYNTLTSLPYLEAVCRETLRLHPPVPFVVRTAQADTTIPLQTPIRGTDGEPVSTIKIEKSSNVLISIYSFNRDPTIWGRDAREWKPERWLEPLPDNLRGSIMPTIYGSTLTFLSGGRACIGYRFALLEIKVMLSVFLRRFHFMPAGKEIWWVMSMIVSPRVKGSDTPQLPLRVRLLEDTDT